MQAIVTKYFGPTDFRGSRVKAEADAGSVTVSWDHALNSEDNHRKAALALCGKLGWTVPSPDSLVGGGLPKSSGYAFVFSGK
jgi:hypothetical protein